MGAGASAVQDAISGASPEELQQAVSALSQEEQKRLADVLAANACKALELQQAVPALSQEEQRRLADVLAADACKALKDVIDDASDWRRGAGKVLSREAVKSLLDARADPNLSNSYHEDLLQRALHHGGGHQIIG